MTLEQTLGDNPYKSQIISAIQHLNAVDKRPKNSTVETTGNPFEALAIGYILKRRMEFWNDGAFPNQSNHCCYQCCWGGDNPGCKYISCNVVCRDYVKSLFPTARIIPGSGSTDITVHDLLENMAAESNYGTPWTDFVTSFQLEMSGIVMNRANNWSHFSQIVEAFYENVSFLPYFDTVFGGGEYASVVSSLLGGEYRAGYEANGVQLSTIADGTPAVPGTRGETTIKVNSTDATIDTKYWVMYTGLTTADVAWMNAGFGSGAPVVVIPGVTITYREVVVNPVNPPDAIAGQIVTAFGGIPGYASVAQAPFDTVTFTIATGGLLPASDFTGLVGGTSDWVGGETPGVDPIPGHTEMLEIDYSLTVYEQMPGRWFKINDLDAHLFYYELEGSPIDPANLRGAPTYDVAHPIVVLDASGVNCCTEGCIANHTCESGGKNRNGARCFCRPNDDAIQRITDLVITDTGLWTKESDTNNVTRWTSIAEVDGELDGGTAQQGNANVVTELIAPSGRVYQPGINYYNDIDFAEAYNRIVVPGEAARGEIISFLVPMAVGYKICYDANGNFCDWVECGVKPQKDCCDVPACTGVVTSAVQRFQTQLIARPFFLKTNYNAMVSMLPFNVPGNRFAPSVNPKRCKDCLI